jgi:hypothetical protein
MNRTLRAALAAAALLALPQFASAGPLTWGYRVTHPDGGLIAEQSGVTETTVVVGNLLSVGPQTGVPQPPVVGSTVIERNRAEGRVTILDEESGQSGEFGIWAEYYWQYEVMPDGSHNPIAEGYTFGPTWAGSNSWEGTFHTTLGQHVYDAYSTEPGGLRVFVTDAPVATPEPGTLALAGLGLGAVGLVRARRRRDLARSS